MRCHKSVRFLAHKINTILTLSGLAAEHVLNWSASTRGRQLGSFKIFKIFFIGVRELESIRLRAVGSRGFQVVIVSTLATGLWHLVEEEQSHVKGRQTVWR